MSERQPEPLFQCIHTPLAATHEAAYDIGAARFIDADDRELQKVANRLVYEKKEHDVEGGGDRSTITLHRTCR
jgi:hypothetical protein